MDNATAPHDLISEQSTLGSLLLSPPLIPEVQGILKPEDFYVPKHRLIYEIILELNSKGEPADAVTVCGASIARGDTKRIGGGEYLATLISVPPSASEGVSYARIVARHSRQRKLIQIGDRLKFLGTTPTTSDDEVDSLIAQADSFLRELDKPTAGMGFPELIENWRAWERDPRGCIPTPWTELNPWIHGGIHRGQLVVVGARPAAGKSSAGLNMILEAAEKGHNSIAFSLEMDSPEVASRLLAAATYSPFGEIIGKRMTRETWQRVEEYISSHQGLPLEVVDTPSLTVEEVVGHCRARKPEAIFVDYAQLLSPTGKRETRDAVTHITRSLKIAAKQLQMAVIVASQLNREAGEKGKPSLKHLAESDAIGRDADIVLLLQREDENLVNLYVEKNRNGRTGKIELVFRGNMARLG